MWIVQNRYGYNISNKLFKTPKEAEEFIANECGGSNYLSIVKVSDQTKLDNFG